MNKQTVFLQAITTRYLGPRNKRGSRIIATSAGGVRLSMEVDNDVNIEENHRLAAYALKDSLKWDCELIGDSTKDGFAFVSFYE